MTAPVLDTPPPRRTDAPTGPAAPAPRPQESDLRARSRADAGGERYSPLVQLTLAKMRDFLREPEALFWVFVFPLLLAVALGLAFREKPPDRVAVGVLAGAGAERAAAALGRSDALTTRTLAPGEANRALRSGKISLLVEPGSGRSVVFRYDPTRPEAHIASLEAREALERAAGRADVLAVRSEHVTEKGARYIDFLIPGLLGMNLMGTGIWGLAFSITVARQRFLLKRLIATPMRRSEYLLAQILGRLVFLVPEVVVLVGVGWLGFGVAVHGSLLLLFATCILGSMAFCGLGLLICSRVRTVEGASGWANLVMMPMWLLSGVFFSYERFPDRLQPIIRALPLTAFNDALRGIMNDGRSLAGVAGQLAIVAGWGLACYLVALRVFRWR